MKARIAVKRVASEEDKLTRLSLDLAFDSKRIGQERTQRIWEGVALIVAGVLDGDEVAEFIEKLNAAKKKKA